jgi:hypothetical protein
MQSNIFYICLRIRGCGSDIPVVTISFLLAALNAAQSCHLCTNTFSPAHTSPLVDLETNFESAGRFFCHLRREPLETRRVGFPTARLTMCRPGGWHLMSMAFLDSGCSTVTTVCRWTVSGPGSKGPLHGLDVACPSSWISKYSGWMQSVVMNLVRFKRLRWMKGYCMDGSAIVMDNSR